MVTKKKVETEQPVPELEISPLQMDLIKRPYLIIDDLQSQKVIAVAIKNYLENGDYYSSFLENPRFLPINNQQYYLIAGDNSVFQNKVNFMENEQFSPLDSMKRFCFNYKTQNKKLAPGKEIAKIAKQNIENVFDQEQLESIGLVLISNSLPYNPNDAHIYSLKSSANQVLIDSRLSSEVPAHAVSRKTIFDLYQKYISKYETPHFEEKVITIIASLVQYLSIIYQQEPDIKINPTLIDLVTIPFEPFKENKNRARYDSELVNSYYQAALEFLNNQQNK